MVNRKSGRKAPVVAKFDASYQPTRKVRSTKASRKAGKIAPSKKPKSAKAGPKRAAAAEKVVEDKTDYEVEAIWGIQRISKNYNDVDVLIKWVGFDNPTWETLENAKQSSELLKPFKKAIDRVGGKLKLENEDELLSDADSDETESDKEYEVEDIIGVQYSKKNGRIEYLVKWKSYPYNQCTWEPKENVDDLAEYLAFFEEAVETLVETNRIGIESKRTPAKKRRFDDSDGEEKHSNVDEGEANEEEVQGDQTSKRGRARSSVKKSVAKKPVNNGSASRPRRSRK